MRFVDCNGLGGGMALGIIEAGFTLTHKCGDLDLGSINMDANRHITGWEWEFEKSPDPRDWYVPDDVDVVAGSPPCSGFSTLSRADFRGSDSAANKHMHSFVEYAARVKPKIAVFESVQHAFGTGRDLMQALRDKIETISGYQYDLTHLMHNSASNGGAANRPRYFWVAHRVPFGVEYPKPEVVPTFLESIGDLRGLAQTWESQPYRYPETWWSTRRRNPNGTVDGHMGRNHLTHAKRIQALLDALDGEWPQGWREQDAVKHIYDKYGTLPDIWKTQQDRLVNRNFDMGFNQMMRWPADRPCRVITGGALGQAMHPTENRLLTNREAARIQGFPDYWNLWPLRNERGLHRIWGKGVPLDSSRWLGYWMKRALDGDPGTMIGAPIGDRERLLQVDKGFKQALSRGMRHHQFWSDEAPSLV